VRAQEAAAHVANLTGGWVEFLETPEEADNIYSRILPDISERYVIGYYPTNEGSHANLRKVKIDVPLHSDYVVHGCQSYYFAGVGATRNSLKLDR
jgi:hypothetical protein